VTQKGAAFSSTGTSTTTAYRYFMAICFGLVAWFWCTAGEFAQERPASSQSPGPASRADVVAPSDFPWETVEWVERRYKIEAMHFEARDETGLDWWGDDDVMISTVDARGWTVSEEIGSVDSGETFSFDPAKSCIVAVRPGIVVLGETSVCDDVGEPAPLWFEVEFWEKDFEILPDIPTGFCNSVGPGTPEPGRHGGPHFAHDSCDDNDDFIGRARLEFAMWELEAALPNVGDEFIETVVLNACSGPDVCDVTYGPDYSFTYRITRLADVRVDLREMLDEARRSSGARSELEAIVAGLKSLRAPSPRKIEPETGNLPSER
jgi:hypothetical protein